MTGTNVWFWIVRILVTITFCIVALTHESIDAGWFVLMGLVLGGVEGARAILARRNGVRNNNDRR